jgi:hypothetical protein
MAGVGEGLTLPARLCGESSGRAGVAIIWFSDEDRERMRREHEECMALRERELLFFEFLRERRPNGGVASREDVVNPRIEGFQIRPWPDPREDDQP